MEHNEMMANPIRHIRFIGYGLTNAWSFMLLFVPLFGAHDSTTVVSGSMLSGALCGLMLLLVSPKLQTIAGRKVLSFLFALGASIGTLLYAYPMFPSSPVALLGLLLSGFCFIGIVVRELRLLKHTRCGASCGMFVSFRSDFMPCNSSGSDRHLRIAARSASDRVVRAYAPFPR